MARAACRIPRMTGGESIDIALVRQRYTAYGGAERFLERTLDTLHGGGAKVTLITRSWQRQPGLEVHHCRPFYLGRLWRDWGFARCVCRQVRARRFPLVQSHERVPCCDVYRAGDGVHREWLAQRRRIMAAPARLAQLLNPYHRYTLAAEQRLFTSARLKAVICNSAMVREEIREHFQVPEGRLHVIYSGVDSGYFHPGLADLHRTALRERLAIPGDALLLLFIGSGFERKGLGAALELLTALPGPVHLLVVGKDRRAGRYRRLAERLGVSPRVRFMGPLQDVRPAYGAADILLLPTLYDPFPNVALEAMAAGLPVITSRKSGAAEVIDPGRSGYVCDALDLPAMADAVRALADDLVRAEAGRLARARVAGLTMDAMHRAYLDLYAGLLPDSASVVGHGS